MSNWLTRCVLVAVGDRALPNPKPVAGSTALRSFATDPDKHYQRDNMNNLWIHPGVSDWDASSVQQISVHPRQLVHRYLLLHSVCALQVATLLLTNGNYFSQVPPPLTITPNAQGFVESGFALWKERCEQEPKEQEPKTKRQKLEGGWKLRDTRNYEVSAMRSCECTKAVGVATNN